MVHNIGRRLRKVYTGEYIDIVNLKREEVSQIHGRIIFRSATQPRVVKSLIMMFVIRLE